MGLGQLLGRLGGLIGRNSGRVAEEAAPAAANVTKALEGRLAAAEGVLNRGTARAESALGDARIDYRTARRNALTALREERSALSEASDIYRASRTDGLTALRAEREAWRAAGNTGRPPREAIYDFLDQRRLYREATDVFHDSQARILANFRPARLKFRDALTTRDAAIREIRNNFNRLTESIDDEISRYASTGVAPVDPVRPGVLPHLGRNWRTYAAGTFGALTLATMTNNIPNVGWLRYLTDKSVGAVVDGLAGSYDHVGATGEGIIANMQGSPEYAAQVLNRALGTTITLDENGRIPEGSLREALSVLATRGVTGSSFYQAPQIIEAYLKEQLNIPQNTDLAAAVTTAYARTGAEIQNQAELEYQRQLQSLATTGSMTPPPAASSTAAPAGAAPATTISVSTLIDPSNGTIANFMKNPSINLTVQFEGVSTIIRNAAGSDNQLSAEEAQRAMTQINSLQNLQDMDRRAINEVIRSSFGMQP